MRNKRALISGLVVIGLLAVATSALTATSTISNPNIYVGSVRQSITGVDVLNVQYTYDVATDEVSAVDFTVDQWLPVKDALAVPPDPGLNVLDMYYGTGAGGPAAVDDGSAPMVSCDQPVVRVDANSNTIDDGPQDYTTVHCTVPSTANVTAVRLNVKE